MGWRPAYRSLSDGRELVVCLTGRRVVHSDAVCSSSSNARTFADRGIRHPRAWCCARPGGVRGRAGAPPRARRSLSVLASRPGAVRDPRDHEPRASCAASAGDEPERCVRPRASGLRVGEALHLEPVVHHREGRAPASSAALAVAARLRPRLVFPPGRVQFMKCSRVPSSDGSCEVRADSLYQTSGIPPSRMAHAIRSSYPGTCRCARRASRIGDPSVRIDQAVPSPAASSRRPPTGPLRERAARSRSAPAASPRSRWSRMRRRSFASSRDRRLKRRRTDAARADGSRPRARRTRHARVTGRANHADRHAARLRRRPAVVSLIGESVTPGW